MSKILDSKIDDALKTIRAVQIQLEYEPQNENLYFGMRRVLLNDACEDFIVSLERGLNLC